MPPTVTLPAKITLTELVVPLNWKFSVYRPNGAFCGATKSMITSCMPGSATRSVFASIGTDVRPAWISSGVLGAMPGGPAAIEPAKSDIDAGTWTISGS